MSGRKYPIIDFVPPMKHMCGVKVRIDELQAVIIRETCSGNSAKEIGQRYGLSECTIENILEKLKEELGCRNKKEFISFCTAENYHKLLDGRTNLTLKPIAVSSPKP